MAHPPVTRGFIPLTIRGWRAEVNGIRRFLRDASKLAPDQGPQMVEPLVAYYTQRLEDLLDNAPEVLVAKGEARQAREGYWEDQPRGF